MQIAHGYAKASGKPMAAILHDLVGLLHATMAIYYAYIDRAPVFIVGATGPMDETSAGRTSTGSTPRNVQGNAVRDYTKWDDQPQRDRRRAGVLRPRLPGGDDRAARARSTCATTRGCRRTRSTRGAAAAAGRGQVPTPAARPIPPRLQQAGRDAVAAERPVIIAEYVGRDPRAFDALVELAETLGAPVDDVQRPAQLPEPPSAQHEHARRTSSATPTWCSCLDVRDSGARHHRRWSAPRASVTSIVPADCEVARHRLRRHRALQLGDGLPAPGARRPARRSPTRPSRCPL